MKRIRTSGNTVYRRVLSTLVMIGLGGPAFGDTERPLPMPPVVVVKVSAMSITQREALERRIDEIANRAANAKPFIYEDSLPIHIKSSFDPVNESLIMNTDERLGPSAGSPDVEDMQSAVRQAISPLIEGIPSFWGVDWRYGGKDIYFWFPQDRVRVPAASTHRQQAGSHQSAMAVRVARSPKSRLTL